MEENNQQDKKSLLAEELVSTIKRPSSSKEQIFNQDSLQRLYEVTINKENTNTIIIAGSEVYQLSIKDINLQKQWNVVRSYEDFAWLFRALKVAFPGFILPYFCSSSVLGYLEKKLQYLNPRERSIYLVSRLQELRQFLELIINHSSFGFSEELRIFLIEDRDEFLKTKRNMNSYIEELTLLESGSERRLSLLERSLSWFSSGSMDKTIQWSKEWLTLKEEICIYGEQLSMLTEKMFKFKHSKQDELNWKEPCTEMDEVERLNAKIISGKPSIQILISELESKILLPLMLQYKKEGQLRRQVEERENLEKGLRQLGQFSKNSEKIERLSKRSYKFEIHFSEAWSSYHSSWLSLMQQIEHRFRDIMQNYWRRMYRIWK